MKFVRLIALVTFGVSATSIRAAEIKGTVKSVNGDIASVAMEGDVMPPNGSKAEIFFKLAGSDEEVSVATGTAGAIDHGALQVKVDKATGNVEPGQLVRFSTSTPLKTTMPTARSASSQPNKPIAFKRAIVGEWKQVFEGSRLTFESGGRLRATEKAGNFTGKYRIDTTKSPAHIDMFEFESAEHGGQDKVILGIFQIEGNRLKLEFTDKAERPTSFGEDSTTATRIGEGADGSIVGTWEKELGIVHTFAFTAEGTVTNYYEASGVKPSTKQYSYRLDDSTSPAQLNFYFGEVNDNPGFRGIVEFDSNDRMRIDGNWTSKEEERPTTFGEDRYELARTR